jgi:hypothetical protein
MKSNIYSFLFFILFLSSQYVIAQTEGGNKNYIPNITVATPQVAALNKVGEIPIDISTGRIGYSIPIFEIKEGSFTMPIGLSYNYSGLLLDEIPGYAGLGWTFNLGGAITHSVNGLNDENHEYDKAYIYSYINKLAPYNDESTPAGQTTIAHFLEDVSNGITDGEPDKYNVSIGNLSCSFYLDKDNNPVFLKNENYKLTGNSTIGFILTDDQGINYIFNLPQIADKVTENDQYSYNSSFLITEINFPFTTNKITFEYSSAIQYTDTNLSQSLIKTTNQLGNPNNDFALRTNTTSTILNTRKLNKIVTNNYTIELQYNNNPNEPAIAVINNLKIKDKLNNYVKNYDFEFSPWTGRRINLLKVKFNGSVTNEMEYDMSVPYPVPTLNNYYLKKDLWGYFNVNATPVIPTGLTNPYANSSIKADFGSTKIGALTKITYQTKGYSLIDYEPNTVYMKSTDYNFPYDSDATTTTTIDAYTSAFDGVTVEKTFVVTNVPAEININYRVANQPEISQNQDQRDTKVVFLKDGDTDANAIFSFNQTWLRELAWIPQTTSFTGSIIKTITVPGTYRIKAISGVGSVASIGVSLKQSPDYFNQTVGGVRIKQIKNCDFNGECITTTYNYTQSGNSTGIMLQTPKFYSGYRIQNNLSCPQGIYVRQDFYNYTSIYPLSNFRGSPVLYKTVEKSDINGGVNNGKTIFTYYGLPSSNSSQDEENYFITGLIDTETVKDRANITLTYKKNTYLNAVSRVTPKFIYGLECKNIIETRASPYNACPMSYPRPLTDFMKGTLKHEAKNYVLQKQESSNYYNGNIIVQTAISDYDLNTSYLKSQTTTNSQEGTLQTKYFYPTDVEMASEPYRNELIAKNMIGIPLVTQNYNGTKLSDQKTEYINDASTSNLLLAKYVYVNKGIAEIDKIKDKKITYDKYDERGNILQYTLESGVPVSIIWGYNKTQPIAKIENLTYASIPAGTITNLQTLSDADNDNCMSGSCTEQLLRNALETFRGTLLNAFISTFTYNPLVGITSITDPKGIPSYYEYDSFNRLKFIKDKDLNVLQKYCYNYKGQQVDCSDNTSTSVVLYKSIARSGSFTKNNCASGGAGASVSYSQAVGAYTSAISQADADANGLTKFNSDGQVYADSNPSTTCTFKNVVKSGVFTRNNCAAGGTPQSITYTVAAGFYSSDISQADADSKAQTDVNNNGQVFANNNTNAKCIFKNVVKSGVFTRNNCAAGGTPQSATYTVAAGLYSSDISQADADSKAQSDVNNNGQAFANNNTNAKCIFKNVVKSGVFTRNNCPAGGTPQSATYTVAAGLYSSDISQADADSKAQSDVNNNGQAFANNNTNAKCIFKNVVKSGVFTRNNCPAGGTPQSATYTVAAGIYSSDISQADADSQAQTDVNNNGQAFANNNNNAKCIFKNVVKSGVFTRNNCVAGGAPQNATYTVAAGIYSSDISQADADSKAQTDVNNNGQVFANNNNNAKCIFYNVVTSGLFYRNNCATGGTPLNAWYTVPAGRYNSTVSQADADSQAQTDVNNNGQAFANNDANAKCIFYSAIRSGLFTRNNCAVGGSPASVWYTVSAGVYNSSVSQADADSKAQTDVNNNGQAFANNDANAKCTFYNTAKSGTFTRNNCAGGVGSTVTYIVAAGSYSSTSSQADADAFAQSAVNNNGLAYANSSGTCTYYSFELNLQYNKNNCIDGMRGSTVYYNVPYGKYQSNTSQNDANNKAIIDQGANGQNYANENGYCLNPGEEEN